MDGLINIKWTPISESHKFYLNIDQKIALEENPGGKSWEIWKPVWLIKNLHNII